MRTILKGGTVYRNGSFVVCDVLIDGEKIARVGDISPHEGDIVVDCRGKHILPGAIDAHVHFREPGAEHKEDWLTGSRAAVAGGVTTVLDMPNNAPPITTQADVDNKRELARKSLVNYGFYVLGCVENKDSLGEFTDIPGFKVYLGSSTGNYLTDDLGVLVDIVRSAKRPIVVHAENEQLIKYFSDKFKESQMHHKMRDNLCAAVSIGEATTIGNYFNAQLHIAHMSTKEEVDFLRKNKTPNITCEVTPHHLFLNEQFFCERHNYGKMNPPLRYQEDQAALWDAIREGLVDMVATDHAPHTRDEKEKDFFSGPCGVPGVQTMLPLMLNAVSQGKIELQDVVRLCSINPAKRFNLERRGDLLEGNFADICIVDMEREAIIKDEDQHSKCGWSPFAGTKIKGWPVMTLVNGRIVFNEGHFSGERTGQEVFISGSLIDQQEERYDITKSFEENKKEGPFGYDDIVDQNYAIKQVLGEYGVLADFFGFKTRLPLGVAAGPLFNSRYMKAAAFDGFEVITWKTFRSEFRLAHRNDGNYLGHNIVYVNTPERLRIDHVGTQLSAQLTKPQGAITITNSFGMGSDEPLVWMDQVRDLEPWMEEHDKRTIASVVGSPKPDWTVQMLADDYAKTALAAQNAGSGVIELNFSCPNVANNSCGKEGSIYKSPQDAALICKTVREGLRPDTKLLIKIGFDSEENYRRLLEAVHHFIDGVVAINTIPMKVVDQEGKQALPGGLVTGTCGSAILDLAVEAVALLHLLRKEMGLDINVFGCGGVMDPEGFMKHILAGADFVFVGTAALFNPQLPMQIAQYLRENKVQKRIY